MKRYYLSPIRQYSEPGLTYWGHHFQQKYPGVQYEAGEIAEDLKRGRPVAKALLVLVDARDHSEYENDSELVPIPDVELNRRVSALNSQERDRATARAVSAAGFTPGDVQSVWGAANDMRAVLNHYGRLNNPQFDADEFEARR